MPVYEQGTIRSSACTMREVKLCSAGLVLGWVAARELHVAGDMGLTFTSASSQITFTRKKRTSGTLQVPINEIYLFPSEFIRLLRRLFRVLRHVRSNSEQCIYTYGLKSSKTLS